MRTQTSLILLAMLVAGAACGTDSLSPIGKQGGFCTGCWDVDGFDRKCSVCLDWGYDPEKHELLTCSSSNIWVLERRCPGGVSVWCDGNSVSSRQQFRCLDPAGREEKTVPFQGSAGQPCLPCLTDCARDFQCGSCDTCNYHGYDPTKKTLLVCNNDYKWEAATACPGGVSVTCDSLDEKHVCRDASGKSLL